MQKKNRINPLSIQSKEWLMNALLELLSEKPYNEITITEMASRAQLTRRTFYRNFETKEDVLNMYIQELCCEYKKLLQEEIILKVHNVAKVYFTFWNKHLEFLAIMEKNNLLFMILQKYNKYLPVLHGELIGNNEELENSNMLEYILTFSAGGFFNTLVKWVHDGAKKSPEEIANIVDKIILKGTLLND